MEYTVILTKQPNFAWRSSVPSLPECEVEGETREEVLLQIKEKVASVASNSEVLQIEIPIEPSLSSENRDEKKWKYFGVFRDDETWGEMFEEIEIHRFDRHLS